MKLAAVWFRADVQHPEGCRMSRRIKAAGGISLTLVKGSVVVLHRPGKPPRIYGAGAVDSYEPAEGEVCCICLAELPEGAKGSTCSKACAAKVAWMGRAAK